MAHRDPADIGSLAEQLEQLRQQVHDLRDAGRQSKKAADRLSADLDKVTKELARARKDQDGLRDDVEDLRENERERSLAWEALRSRLQLAARETAEAERAISLVGGVLAAGLGYTPPSFADLKTDPDYPEFRPGRLALAEPPPRWESYDPGPPGVVNRLMPGRYERLTRDREEEFRRDTADHERREKQRKSACAEARAEHEARASAHRRDAVSHNAAVEETRVAFSGGKPRAIAWFARTALEHAGYPDWYPKSARQVKAVFRGGRVLAELELPPVSVIPDAARYDLDADLREVRPVPRPRSEIPAQYTDLIASVALRSLREVFAATEPIGDVVREVTFNGRLRGPDPATGRDARRHLVSVRAGREAFAGLDLRRLRPAAGVLGLGGRISASPFGLDEVEPLETFEHD
ncbi:MAG: hypothetical protein FWE35_14810 [Streptosporangiales bacterium]|nr:hypothetical protein [Streptosporangiales bacterium]